MSPHDDDQDRLSRGLHEHAQRVHGTPLDLDAVRGRARGIQRRRRAVAGLAAAAVVAVVVPVGLGLGGDVRTDRPVAPATTTPSASSSTSPSPAPSTTAPSPSRTPADGPVPMVLEGTETGAPPRVDFQRGTTYVGADGTETELDAEYFTPTPYRGGWLGIDRDGGGDTYLARIGADGRQTGRVPGSDRIVLDADGLRAVWAETNDDPTQRSGLFLGTTNGHSEGEDSFEAFVPGTVTPIAFLGQNVVYRVDGSGADGDFGTRFFVGPDEQGGVTDVAGSREIKGVLDVRDVDSATARLAVQTSYSRTDGRSCWAVRGNQGGPVSRSCAWTFDAFSPDGDALLGFPSDVDGLGSSRIALLDVTTGKPVVQFEAPGKGFVATAVWEDERHVLASVWADDRWQLVRLGLDGSVEVADRASGGAPESSPYHFAATS